MCRFESPYQMWIAMELCDAGNVETKIGTWRQAKMRNVPENQVLDLFTEILAGMEAIHQAGLVHRDLKPENIFVGRDSQGNPHCKIGDLGLAGDLKTGKKGRGQCGTAGYFAPEMWKTEDHTEKVDVWALGIILVDLCIPLMQSGNQPRWTAAYQCCADVMGAELYVWSSLCP